MRGLGMLLAITALSALAGCAADVHRRVPADPDPFGPIGWLLSPTQGRPILVRAGEPAPVKFRIPDDFAGKIEYWLIDSAAPDQPAIALALAEQLRIVAPPPAGEMIVPAQTEPLADGLLLVPPQTPPGLYDLVIALYDPGAAVASRVKSAPRAVAVFEKFAESFRFVQLSNMNVGSATAGRFSPELVEEVNQLAPAFIITTGDYLEPASAGLGWRQVKEYFAGFEAPVFMLLGESDDVPGFYSHVAPSKCGYFTFGRWQGVLLHDTYSHPIDADKAQYQWLDSVLNDSPAVQFNFLVGRNDSLRVFDAWQKMGFSPREYVQRSRIAMIFVGGYSDWDLTEFAGKLADTPVHYVRTHAASTCIRGKATGVPHYRIVHVQQPPSSAIGTPAANVRVSLMRPENGPAQRALHSIPVGQMQVSYDAANDGSADRLRVTVLNRLTVPLPQIRVKVKLTPGPAVPAIAGGTIERVISRASEREVWIRLDVPDMGAASAVVGPDELLPRPRGGLVLHPLGDSVLRYSAARSPDGFGYFVTDGQLHLTMANTGAEQIEVRPIVQLNGNILPLAGVQPGEPIRLMPNERRTLPIITALALAAPGEHWLTVHHADCPLPFLTRKTVNLVVTDPPAATTQPEP